LALDLSLLTTQQYHQEIYYESFFGLVREAVTDWGGGEELRQRQPSYESKLLLSLQGWKGIKRGRSIRGSVWKINPEMGMADWLKWYSACLASVRP
jgi:hypothetical protein